MPPSLTLPHRADDLAPFAFELLGFFMSAEFAEAANFALQFFQLPHFGSFPHFRSLRPALGTAESCVDLADFHVHPLQHTAEFASLCILAVPQPLKLALHAMYLLLQFTAMLH